MIILYFSDFLPTVKTTDCARTVQDTFRIKWLCKMVVSAKSVKTKIATERQNCWKWRSLRQKQRCPFYLEFHYLHWLHSIGCAAVALKLGRIYA